MICLVIKLRTKLDITVIRAIPVDSGEREVGVWREFVPVQIYLKPDWLEVVRVAVMNARLLDARIGLVAFAADADQLH